MYDPLIMFSLPFLIKWRAVPEMNQTSNHLSVILQADCLSLYSRNDGTFIEHSRVTSIIIGTFPG